MTPTARRAQQIETLDKLCKEFTAAWPHYPPLHLETSGLRPAAIQEALIAALSVLGAREEEQSMDEALAALRQSLPVRETVEQRLAALESVAHAPAIRAIVREELCCCKQHTDVGRCLQCPVHGVPAPAVQQQGAPRLDGPGVEDAKAYVELLLESNLNAEEHKTWAVDRLIAAAQAEKEGENQRLRTEYAAALASLDNESRARWTAEQALAAAQAEGRAKAEREISRLNANLKTLVAAEEAYRANERIAFQRLSLSLTEGNASQWEHIFDAAEKVADAALAAPVAVTPESPDQQFRKEYGFDATPDHPSSGEE